MLQFMVKVAWPGHPRLEGARGSNLCVTLGLSPHCSRADQASSSPSQPSQPAPEACSASCPQARGCVLPEGRLDIKCLLCAGVSQPGRQRPPVPAMFSRHLRLPHACPFNPQARPAPPQPLSSGGWSPAGQGWQGSPEEPSPTPSTRQHPWWP